MRYYSVTDAGEAVPNWARQWPKRNSFGRRVYIISATDDVTAPAM